jgi:uncharacterized protein involved in outer membrane biogenesis
MKATTKFLLWPLSSIVTILLLLWAALLTVDVDNYRSQLQSHISAAFGREVVFAETLSLKPSLTPHLVIEGLKIGNPDWASRPFLAMVDSFSVKLSLLPLLQGKLKILALEFHGVDLKLEQGPAGANNYTFGPRGQPSLLPVIENLELYEADIAWLPDRGVARSHHLQQLIARKVPRQPVEMTLKTTVNGLPLRLSLHGVPGGDSWPFGPWDTTLQGTLGDLSLRLTGAVPRPDEWYRAAFQFELQGDDMHKLEPLLGVDLPKPGYRPADYHLEGLVQFDLNDYLVISELSGEIAGSELSGELRWELSALEERGAGWRQLLEVGEFALRAQGSGPLWQQQYRLAGELTQLAVHEIEVAAQPQQPLLVMARGSLGDTALTVSLQAEPLGKLAEHSRGPWQNLALDVRGKGIGISVSGSVAHPLEASGFDISYTFEGAEFATLLGQSGEFALSGRYRDQPGRHLLDELSARIGETDLSGRVMFHIPADWAQPQEKSPVDQPSLARESHRPDLQEMLQHVELDLVVQPPAAISKQEFSIAGRTFRLETAPIQVRAQPGQALLLSTVANINEKPVQLSLRSETLRALVDRPTGPWHRQLLQGEGENFRFKIQGDLERPLEASGLDVTYELEGAEIDALLPVIDIFLPLQGPYQLSGHFSDSADGKVFDQLRVRFGSSDITGHFRVVQGEQRPRIVAHLSSEQLYLMEFLTTGVAPVATDPNGRVIADFELPIERLREFDGELYFTGKRLRTAAADLGDINLQLSLENQLLRVDQFQVHGWAGALIDAAGSIDASRNPAQINLQLSARDINYGAFLQQAGMAETVTGTLDITVGLRGEGGSSHEFLSTASGRLIVLGEQGRFGSRRLDLWGADLFTTMLSPDWHSEDVTDLLCMIANINIQDGLATTDELLIDTRRITIGASGTLDLGTEELNLVFAPRPKRSSLASLTSPAHVTGTLSAPEVSVTMLPRRRMTIAGTGLLAGLLNPAYLLLTFGQLGSGDTNPCAAAVETARVLKAEQLEQVTN